MLLAIIVIWKYIKSDKDTIAIIVDENTIEYKGATYYQVGCYCSYVGKQLGTAKQKGDWVHPFVTGWFPNIVYKVYDFKRRKVSDECAPS